MNGTTTFTERLLHGVRQQSREAQATRRHFAAKGKPSPPWTRETPKRVENVMGYLYGRLGRENQRG